MEMESLLPKPTKGGIKMYLRRRRSYRGLDGEANATTNGKRKKKTIRLRRSPRRYWRIRRMPRLRWVITSPLKMLTYLKNAYMNFMLRSTNTDNIILGGKRITKAREVPNNDYSSDAMQARLIYEISKALVASHGLYPM